MLFVTNNFGKVKHQLFGNRIPVLLCNYFTYLTKEQLIEIIANKAERDASFELYIKNYLSGSESADDVLKMFLKSCEQSRGWKESDIDIIEEGGSLFLEKMERLPASVSKIKAYILANNEIDALLNEVYVV